jgi:hypothetical protein
MFTVEALEIVTFAGDGDVAAQSAAGIKHNKIEDRMARAPQFPTRTLEIIS